MEKGVLGDGREIILRPGDQVPDGPMSTDELKRALSQGPDFPMSNVRGTAPPMPEPIFQSTPAIDSGSREEKVLEKVVQDHAQKIQSAPMTDLIARATGHSPVGLPQPKVQEAPPQKEEQPEEKSVAGEGPDEEFKKDMVLPSEAEKAALKSKYPGTPLRVVPIPYSRSDGKIQAYVLRQLTRSQWRAMETSARTVSESKPDISANDIFMEKIVCLACVWPDIQEHQIRMAPAGLVPTLFGIVQQMGLFFDPEVIMQLTFAL